MLKMKSGRILKIPRAASSSTSTVVSVGTDVAVAMPIIAGGISHYKDDETGVAEMGVASGGVGVLWLTLDEDHEIGENKSVWRL